MNRRNFRSLRSWALSGAAIAAIASPAWAQDARRFEIPQQSLIAALEAFGKQGDAEILFSRSAAEGRSTGGVVGDYEPAQALSMLLDGSGLRYRQVNANTYVVEAADPQGSSAAGGGAEVEALIVTAQKREEDIQDVPIAISAFTQEDLTRSQVAGGPDLMTQVPNFTFTKTNFSSYSIQIRGIGTQAISATTDAAVAVAFNNTPFIRNRFFEQEFYDLERVEVLRGPQGTLYGRNATAGVVNIISAKPKFLYEAKVSADVANYNSTRLEGMINVPLVDDVVALRFAGAWTKRDGYATNEITGNPIDGRDLWSTRLSLRFAPTDRIDANLIWEHFEENDDRLRSGKQLCKRHLPPAIGGLPVNYGDNAPGSNNGLLYEEYFSQGCEAASLYSPDSFQAPVGLRLPYYRPLARFSLPIYDSVDGVPFDPYASTTQSRDLRVIESTVDPQYRAKTDLGELQVSFDLTDNLTLTSETGYLADTIFSTQDYNRFNTRAGAFNPGTPGSRTGAFLAGVIDENGVFCDPQIGCADRVVAVDLSTAKSRHFSEEIRLSSNFDGPLNFSLGTNFLRYDTEDKYYVFVNTLTLAAAARAINWTNAPSPYEPGVSDNSQCLPRGFAPPTPDTVEGLLDCTYIDPNPIGSLNDLGHTYFLSRNPYKLLSYAVFGEAYYNISDSLKITAGLRWTVDKKQAPRIPSWVLASNTVGYPVAEIVEQEWREPTGRLTLDWKPDLSITDETLLYASYAHGYKAGGANPPAAGLVMYANDINSPPTDWELQAAAQDALSPKTFEPEFVDAFEVGAKNTVLDGRLTLNLAGFYYDYEGYQISRIVSRSAINSNFDARVWGLELEADWRALENLRFGLKVGYEDTRLADGSRAIDTMDRTAGRDDNGDGIPDWYVTAPFPSLPNNCILPTYTVVHPDNTLWVLGYSSGGNLGPCELAYVLGQDPVQGGGYVYPGYPGFDPHDYPDINGGAGFYKDLSGNELPNAPHYTATLTADYTLPLPNDWLASLHTDLYYQSEAWTRVFNTPGYDKLKAYTNVNLAAIFTNEDAGWKVMAYIKNVFDRDSITGAFLNSDDTGLTTNVFLTEPRLYGLRVTKEWSGGPWWTGADPASKGPFPLTVELGGQVQRQDAPYERLSPQSFSDVDPVLNTIAAVQNRDLDWGDGRSIRLIYRPSGSPWHVSAGVRYGRANSDTARLHVADREAVNTCAIASYAYLICYPGAPFYQYQLANYVTHSFSDTAARNHEEHTIIDFEVGHDFGLGSALSDSKVALGVRYGDFSSSSTLTAAARGDWDISESWYKYGVRVTDYTANLRADREFSGAGPTLSWDAALVLLGNDRTGRLKLDWSVAGGILFGKQKTEIVGDDMMQRGYGLPGSNYHPRGGGWPIPPEGPPTIFDPDRSRSQDVSVPLADLSLGLSYDIGRINIGTGYRWERYFDVLDVGYDEAKDGDRTLDGPYFKLSVGFGG